MQPLISKSITKGLRGVMKVAGDKSISHRALILSSQALGTTIISGLLEGEDVMSTAAALRAMGVIITKLADGRWQVQGVGIGGMKASKSVLDMGNSGTSTRLLMGLITPYPFSTNFTGDHSLRTRPMARALTPLSLMGASYDGEKLPLTLTGTASPKAIEYILPVASAQVKSAILLAALNTQGTTTVIEPHATRDHTENMLAFFDIPIDCKPSEKGMVITLNGKPKQVAKDREITVPTDPSSAAFAVVAALITPNSHLTLRHVCMNPLRTGLFTTLLEMGADISIINPHKIGGEDVADLVVKASALKGVVVPAERAPSMIDEYPILSVAAAFAEGETTMLGLEELRVKESDRLSAILNALTACGVTARADGDNLTVTGGKVAGDTTITTHYDHRIAMSFLVMGLASEKPITVDDASAIATSFPNFVTLMNSLGAKIAPPHRRLVVAVDGPAASGKGTLARRIAEYFDLEYLDTGSLYRAVGMKLIYGGYEPTDKEAAIAAARAIEIDDLSNPRLRQERIGKAASVISAYPEVRQALLEYQQQFAKNPRGAVLDGRDIGTVICPNADYKFFITATLFARAKRRHRELEGQGIEVVFDSVLEDLRTRDERDANRTIAPLVAADDAVIIEASAAAAHEIFDKVRGLIEKRS